MTNANSQLDLNSPQDDGEPDESESFLDGYIAAIAVSPEDIPFSTWAVPLFGDGAAPPQDEVELALDRLRHRLAMAPDKYVPLYCTTDENFAKLGLVYAAGFIAGMTAANVAWTKRMRGEDYWHVIEPIAALAMQREDFTSTLPVPFTRPEPMSEEDLEECLEMIPASVTALYQLRLKHMAALPRRSHVKPGRNDPCTCGSGKKYKKCCGR